MAIERNTQAAPAQQKKQKVFYARGWPQQM